jgi:hypothetical protein
MLAADGKSSLDVAEFLAVPKVPQTKKLVNLVSQALNPPLSTTSIRFYDLFAPGSSIPVYARTDVVISSRASKRPNES